MKTKQIVAAIVSALALTAGAAAPAFADDFRGSPPAYGYGYHQDWRARSQITVRTQRGQFTVDRRDPMFFRLTDRPYRFRPGFTYIYTDRCNRNGCMVLEFAQYSRMPTDRFFAPYLRFDRIGYSRDDRWRQDDRAWRGGDNDDPTFDRNSDSRDFRNNAPPPSDRGLPPPQAGGNQYNGQFNGNGYHRDSGLLGGRN